MAEVLDLLSAVGSLGGLFSIISLGYWLGRKFAQIEERFRQIDERFKIIDVYFKQIDARFERVDNRFEGWRHCSRRT